MRGARNRFAPSKPEQYQQVREKGRVSGAFTHDTGIKAPEAAFIARRKTDTHRQNVLL